MANKFKNNILRIFLIFIFQVHLCLSCTFPDDLSGTFDSTREGSIDFNSTTYGKFTISTQSNTFSDLEFTCHINSGTKYVSKSQKFTIFSSQFNAYMCLDIRPVYRNLFYYYYATTILPQANNARVKIFPDDTVVGSVSMVCDESIPYQSTYSLLLKNDTVIGDEMVECPEDLQGYYSYIFNDGTNTYCENQTSLLDTCTSNTTFSFDYNTCNDSILYSASGVLYCLYYQQISTGLYYLTLYNSDNTTDNTNTYKYSCMVFEKGENVSYASQYPMECQNSTYMNSTTVPSPGASIVFTNNGSCEVPTTTTITTTISTTTTIETTVESTTEPTAAPVQDVSSASITGGIIGAVIFVALLVVLVVILMKNNKRNDDVDGEERGKDKQKNKNKVEPKGLPPKKRVDRNARPIFTPAPPKINEDVKTKAPSSIFDMDSEEGLAPSLEKEYTLPIYSDYGDCSDLEEENTKTPPPTFIDSKKIHQRLRDSGIVMTPPPDSTIPPTTRSHSTMTKTARSSKLGQTTSTPNQLTEEPTYGPNFNPVKDTPV